MSGTSLDGIDVAIACFDPPKLQLRAFYSTPWHAYLRRRLMELATAHRVEMDALVQTHFILAETYARAVEAALEQAHLSASDIRAIGLHGQTVRHLPRLNDHAEPSHPGTLQLGSGAALAALTGIDVVSDFRSADMALGGQGAPLVPMFDYPFLRSDTTDRLLVNIGGIANVTWLPRGAREEDIVAFDCGPGNMLMDSVARRYFNADFDKDGIHAEHGKINEELVSALLSNPYFDQPPPKSTGRELFSDAMLKRIHGNIAGKHINAWDALSTLTEVTARAIARSLEWVGAKASPVEIIVSGGGAFNTYLLERIAANAPNASVVTSDTYGIPPQAKEAIAFAFFAKAFIENIPIHLPKTTGAKRKVILGSLSRG